MSDTGGLISGYIPSRQLGEYCTAPVLGSGVRSTPVCLASCVACVPAKVWELFGTRTILYEGDWPSFRSTDLKGGAGAGCGLGVGRRSSGKVERSSVEVGGDDFGEGEGLFWLCGQGSH
jgi:hypothetical protein